MTTVVRFRSSAGHCALPVEHVTEVRSASELTPLPEPRPGVAGLMRRGDEALPVLSVLGTDGEHVIVVDEGGLTFGLLVGEVTGVQAIDDSEIGPPPPGQERIAVSGILTADDGLVLRDLLERLAATGSAARRHGQHVGILMMDIDRFKAVNDTFGHDGGDRVLRSVATRLSTACRTEDVAGRWGGEEFLVIAPFTDLLGVAVLAERIRAATASECAG